MRQPIQANGEWRMAVKSVWWLLGVLAAGTAFGAEGTLSIEAIRERIAAIDVCSVQSAAGHLIVSGPDSFGNALLLAQVEETALALETLTGIALPFGMQSVRVLVTDTGYAGDEDVMAVRHVFSGGGWIHRAVLADYAGAQTEEGREVLCRVLLAVYTAGPSPVFTEVPVWLWRGAARVQTLVGRQMTLEQAYALWRQGRLPAPRRILAGRAASAADDEIGRIAFGAFMIWLAALPERPARFSAMFRHLVEGGTLDSAWVEAALPAAAGTDLDEHWDRWMLRQRHAVRLMGAVSTAHLEALRSEWLIFPGRDGIPRGVSIAQGAGIPALADWREASWFAAAVREKRRRIEWLAPGRPALYQAAVAAYLEVLEAVARGERETRLEPLSAAAAARRSAIEAQVEAAGGLWVEP